MTLFIILVVKYLLNSFNDNSLHPDTHIGCNYLHGEKSAQSAYQGGVIDVDLWIRKENGYYNYNISQLQ